MKSTTLRRALCVAAALIGAGGIAATALAQDQGKNGNGNGKRDRADFVRGNASSKAPRVVPPKNEQEAIAARKVTAAGIIEMQLPEDRMVNLVRIENADGSVSYEHLAEGQTLPAKAQQGEVE